MAVGGELTAAVRLDWVEETGSTSADLVGRAEAGEGEMALGARRQTGGRGRLGRQWWSEEGNLHLSVLLRPGRVARPGHWSLLAGVVVGEAVAAAARGREVRLKWPNDVVLDGGKVAGILLEAGGDWVVMGFGVNLAHAPEGLGRAVSFVGAGDVEGFAEVLLAGLGRWRARYAVEGFGAVRAAWMGMGPGIGARMVGGGVEGVFAGLGEDGALLLNVGGQVTAIVSGEVLAAPDHPPAAPP